jgi:hypothetical protein
MSVLMVRFDAFCYHGDRLCSLVVRVPGYRSRGPGSIQVFCEVVGLERVTLSLVSTIEELPVAAPV